MIDIICSQCKTSLEADATHLGVEVTPCPNCLEDAEKEAHDEGKDEGYEKALNDIDNS